MVEKTTPAKTTATKKVEDIPTDKVEEIYTPRDTIDALRLIRKEGLLEPDDDDETRKHVRNLVVEYLSEKRAGTTTLDLNTWLDTDMSGDEGGEEADPT